MLFSPDGAILASAGLDGYIRFTDTQLGRELGVAVEPKKLPVGRARPQNWAMAFSPDGKELAAVAVGEPMRFFDPTKGTTLRAVGKAVNYGVAQLLYTPGGQHLLKDGVVIDVKTGEFRAQLEGGGGRSSNLISPDGRHFVRLSSADGIRVFDAATFDSVGSEKFEFNDDDPGRQSAVPVAGVFSPDGANLVVAHKGGYLSVWSFPTLKRVRAVRCYPDTPQSLHFTPDGKRVAACGNNGVISYWNWAALSKADR
jgi:WD40 repeat protein